MNQSALLPILGSSLLLAATACQTVPESAAPQPPAFVEAACGGCHATQPPYLSPNPQAPSFEAIANRPGLNERTLKGWLRDAHNYPEMMDFDLQEEHVEEVADYILTLQSADYRPAP